MQTKILKADFKGNIKLAADLIRRGETVAFPVISPEESAANRLRELGVSEIVEPAFEASLEFVWHTLSYYKVDTLEIEGIACPFLKEREGDITARD